MVANCKLQNVKWRKLNKCKAKINEKNILTQKNNKFLLYERAFSEYCGAKKLILITYLIFYWLKSEIT